MVFSSVIFLFYFLPAVCAAYYLSPRRWRNMVLLLSSLLFYFIGEGVYVLLLLFSVMFNGLYGRFLERHRTGAALCAGAAVNLLLLGWFKYAGFIAGLFGIRLAVHLPAGISFFTFQAVSYLADIRLGRAKAAERITDFAAYLTMFPQLIAGPIVRWRQVSDELQDRRERETEISYGILRFIRGLFYKLVLADTLGSAAAVFGGLQDPCVLTYWMHAAALTMQIYFDFSGYSDMAIGMGLFFGFHFPENFRYPLTAVSVRDFWTRWHMTLSSFFRDYVYIPLGGSRSGTRRYVLAMLAVWALTGLWHGAAWNFVFWGLWFAAFLLLEKFVLRGWTERHRAAGHLYTLVTVMLSFVIFSFGSAEEIISFFRGMSGAGVPLLSEEGLYYAGSYFRFLVICGFFATPFPSLLFRRVSSRIPLAEPLLMLVLFGTAVSFLLGQGFHPFLYFRF